MKIQMRFEGGEQLAKNLAQLSDRLSKQVLRQALREGGEVIRAAGARNAPHEPGAPDLREHIGMSNARTDQQAAIAIGPTKDFFYGVFQELGTVHHSAQPFMRPAFDTERQRALAIISDSLWRAMIKRGFSSRVGQGTTEVFGSDEPDVIAGPGGSLL